MKRTQPKRDWTDAHEKTRSEDGCRGCGRSREWNSIAAAHVVGRAHDEPKKPGSKTLYVRPDRIVPLCMSCHHRYDPHTRGLNEEPLDLLPSLTDEEKRQAFEDCDYDALKFLRRVCGVGFVPEEATQ